MAVPRNRMSNARKNSKRAHHAKTPKSFSACSACGATRMPHCACPSCGVSSSARANRAKKAAQ